jgi:NitT/TauT family transport system permease protein
MALALGAGGSAGFLVGLVMWRLPLLGRGWRPVLSSLYAVPLSTFYPALLLATGVGDIPVVLLGAAAALPAVAVATSIGLAEVPSVFFKLARVYRCSWRQALWKLLLPAALPDLIAGVRLAMIYSLIYVVALEFINADNGLGFLLRFNYEFFRPKDMYAYVLLVVCLALFQHTVLDYVVGRLRQRFE